MSTLIIKTPKINVHFQALKIWAKMTSIIFLYLRLSSPFSHLVLNPFADVLSTLINITDLRLSLGPSFFSFFFSPYIPSGMTFVHFTDLNYHAHDHHSQMLMYDSGFFQLHYCISYYLPHISSQNFYRYFIFIHIQN